MRTFLGLSGKMCALSSKCLVVLQSEGFFRLGIKKEGWGEKGESGAAPPSKGKRSPREMPSGQDPGPTDTGPLAGPAQAPPPA